MMPVAEAWRLIRAHGLRDAAADQEVDVRRQPGADGAGGKQDQRRQEDAFAPGSSLSLPAIGAETIGEASCEPVNVHCTATCKVCLISIGRPTRRS